MNLEGSLETFGLPDILTLLSTTSKTGSLSLQGPSESGRVELVEGKVTGALSSASETALLQRLVSSGVLDEAGLEALAEARRSDASADLLGVVRDGGLASDTDLDAACSQAAADAVCDVLCWSSGSFSFQPGEQQADPGGTALDVAELIEQGQRRREAWAKLSDRVADDDMVLSLSLDLAAEVTLGPAEWRLLALVDGRRRVRDLVALAGGDRFDALTLLADLVERHLVRSVDGSDTELATLLRRHELLTRITDPASVAADGGAVPPAAGDPGAGPGGGVAVTSRPVPVGAGVGATDGALAMAPVAHHPSNGQVPGGGGAKSTEEDAAVTRSLLLRLIAGVSTL